MRLNSSTAIAGEPLVPLDSALMDERTYDARAEFADVFSILLEARSLPLHTDLHQTSLMDKRIASQLQHQLDTLKSELQDLARHTHYSRHVIGTDGDWVGYVCRWEPHVSSCVHGHPSFAYYQVYAGNFDMELYDVCGINQIEHAENRSMQDGDCIWQQGNKNCYDNMVHKVVAKDSGGFTVHLFSENPALGQHFHEH